MRVLCVCRRVYEYIRTIKLDALYAQYFPAPVRPHRTPRSQPPYTIFLWQRDAALGLEQVVKVLGRENIAKVILKTDTPVAKSAACAVENIVGWLSEDDYRRLLEDVDFYFAPRFQEGIGFSFLEPMACGIPVIGHDDATMNEYIKDGKTSLLFDRSFRLRSSLVSPAALYGDLIADFDKGYKNWQASIPALKSFIMNA
jgi:glycosyltransferase involved in cell wall biosynthesis